MDDRLSEELATPDPAIRDFLKIPQDDAGAGAHEGGSPTALDGRGVTNWKPLRDRLRLRRAANAWLGKPAPKAGGAPAAATATTNSSLNHRSNKYNYSPGEAAAAFSRTFSRTPSLRTTTPTFCRVGFTRVGPNNSSRSSSRRRASAYEPRYEDHDDADEDNHDDNDDSEGEKDDDEEEAPAAQMSLMALLEQTDSWDDDDEDDEEGGGEARKNGGGDDDGEGREEEMVHVCCVCMVRHKGAAFAPCGHTFCRLCSRELWVSRGNCPLCNGFIQEILDIF